MNPEQFEYYTQRPLGNLTGFVAQPIVLTEIAFDGHGFSGKFPDDLTECLNIVFKVNCKCGNHKHLLIAESDGDEIYYHNGFLGADRFYLRCSSCGKQTLLFDPLLHGCNAEIFKPEESAKTGEDLYPTNIVGVAQTGEYSCQDCGNQHLEVFARFEYPGDSFEDPAHTGRTQEFFSWFTPHRIWIMFTFSSEIYLRTRDSS